MAREKQTQTGTVEKGKLEEQKPVSDACIREGKISASAGQLVWGYER